MTPSGFFGSPLRFQENRDYPLASWSDVVAFRQHDNLELTSACLQVGGRLLKYSYQAGRVSQWIASKLQSSIIKNMVFPSCSDIPLPHLLAVDSPHVAFMPTNFLRKGKWPCFLLEYLLDYLQDGCGKILTPTNYPCMYSL